MPTQSLRKLCFPSGVNLMELLRELGRAGGKPIIVGGWVRDLILGSESDNIDIEVFGLCPDLLEEILSRHGRLLMVGKAFSVYRVQNLDVEFSLPRRDSKVSPGHKGFEIETLPNLPFEEASRRRDFTINAMGLDPFSGQLLDPWNGEADLKAGLLEVVDPTTFPDDPLRVLRGAQFLSRFALTAGKSFLKCSREMNADELPKERIYGEISKMLFGREPSRGARFLLSSGWLRYFPEWASLVGLPQDSIWHPEGDVWEHVLLALDEAAKIRTGLIRDDLILMFGVLCHDFGKASTTRLREGKIRSIGHTQAGVEPAQRFMSRLTQDKLLTAAVEKLVREHLTPLYLYSQKVGAGALRRLARRLSPEVNIELLELCSRADFMASGNRSEGSFEAGEWILEMSRRNSISRQPEEPVLKGRHLVQVGLEPGPLIGRILKRAYEIQTEEGEKRISVLRDRARIDAEKADPSGGEDGR